MTHQYTSRYERSPARHAISWRLPDLANGTLNIELSPVLPVSDRCNRDSRHTAMGQIGQVGQGFAVISMPLNISGYTQSDYLSQFADSRYSSGSENV